MLYRHANKNNPNDDAQTRGPKIEPSRGGKLPWGAWGLAARSSSHE